MCFSCTSLTELLEDILLLGRLVERDRAGQELVTGMHRELVDLARRGQELATAAGRRPRIHLEEWGPKEPFYIAGDWAAEMLTIAGAENVFAHRQLRCPSPQRTCTDVEIADADPDILITAWCGCGEKVDLTRVANRPSLANARVVREGWLRCIDDRFVMRPGPRILEGVRRMQGVIAEWGASVSKSRETPAPRRR